MYASPDDYKLLYPDTDKTDAQITALLTVAETEIDGLTYNRIVAKGYVNLTPFQQEKVKTATCMQAKFDATYSDFINSPFAAYGINGVSMSFDAKKVIQQNGITTSAQVYGVLTQTGLTNRGIW